MPLAVLSTLLGGGDSFSSGGPGKGMTSKLYENVLNRHHYVASALATHFMYGTTGMFTLKGSCDASFAGQLATVLAKELKELVDKVNAADLERARNATASIVLINNEHGAINAEDMGRQVHAPHFARKIQTVSPAIHLSISLSTLLRSCSRAAARRRNSFWRRSTLSPPPTFSASNARPAVNHRNTFCRRVAKGLINSKVALAAVGDVSYVPSYDTIAQLFK